MDRDQLAEHLRFAAELGVEGLRLDREWRTRVDHDAAPEGAALRAEPSRSAQASASASYAPAVEPVTLYASQADALLAVKTEI
ncbi:MAG TPA: hypothetical protein VKD69_19340, partial [Vicinamibacterales bacterium]|nr:hypothetical protein [Vicinamibacterales bacterium]